MRTTIVILIIFMLMIAVNSSFSEEPLKKDSYHDFVKSVNLKEVKDNVIEFTMVIQCTADVSGVLLCIKENNTIIAEVPLRAFKKSEVEIEEGIYSYSFKLNKSYIKESTLLIGYGVVSRFKKEFKLLNIYESVKQ